MNKGIQFPLQELWVSTGMDPPTDFLSDLLTDCERINTTENNKLANTLF